MRVFSRLRNSRFLIAVAGTLLFAIAIAGCGGGGRTALPTANQSNLNPGSPTTYQSAVTAAGQPYSTLRAQPRQQTSGASKTRRTQTAFNSSTSDECFDWSTAECVVQGVATNLGQLSVACNGNSACLSSSYAPYVLTAPTGVSVTFSPTAITPPAGSTITVTFSSAVAPGPVSVTFAWTRVSGTGAIPANITIPFQSLCSISLAKCPRIQIVDTFMTGSPVVSGSPPPLKQTVVGKKSNWVLTQVSGTGTGTYGPPTDVWWIVPGWNYTDYSRNGAAPTSLGTSDYASPTPPPLFWTDNNEQHVTVSATLVRSDNQEIADVATALDYNVNRPDTSVSVTSGGAAAVRVGTRSDFPGTFLTFGDQATPAMHFSYNVTNDKGFPGTIGMTQLLYTAYSYTGPNNASGGATYGSATAPLLDNVVDYVAPVSTASTITAIDAPGTGTPAGPTYNALSSSGTFTDYFMYKANGTNTVWVTLNKASWAWSGSAMYNLATQKWCLDSAPGCPTTVPAPTGGVTDGPWQNFDQPAWPGVYANHPDALHRFLQSHSANRMPITPLMQP